MNTDKLTTTLGAVAALSAALAQFNVAPEYSGLVSALAIAGMGYYTNKGRKPSGS